MFRKMIKCTRSADELGDDFFPRLQRRITSLMSKHCVLSWDIRARESYFKFAGQISRMARTDPHRLSPLALNFQIIKPIREYACRNGGNQWHGRFVHVWRWESDIVDYAEGHYADQEALASNVTDWFSLHLEEFKIQESTRDNLPVRGHKRCRRQ